MHFIQLEIPRKKRNILSEKRESGMALKKREFTSKSGNVDTYVMDPLINSGVQIRIILEEERAMFILLLE